MESLLPLLWVVGCCVLVTVLLCWTYRRPRVFHDIITDPVFGRLEWQGYGNGDWWQGELHVDTSIILFQIGGSTRPDIQLVQQAQTIATTYSSFRQELDRFLVEEVHRRPAEAAIIAQLIPTRIALFPEHAEESPDAYQGAFVVLAHRKQLVPPALSQEEWRCDIHAGSFTNLREWA